MTDENKNEELQGEEITEDKMDAEEKVRAELDADRVAIITRGIAKGFIAVHYDGKKDPPKQSDPAIQLLEPIMDCLYFLLKDIQRTADAQERIAFALETQAEIMLKLYATPEPELGAEVVGELT